MNFVYIKCEPCRMSTKVKASLYVQQRINRLNIIMRKGFSICVVEVYYIGEINNYFMSNVKLLEEI